jgi:hypothetical protein
MDGLRRTSPLAFVLTLGIGLSQFAFQQFQRPFSGNAVVLGLLGG